MTGTEEPLRVLVVDDTALYRKVISDALAALPGVTVVGTAANGAIALKKCAQLRPDLLTLDLEMPEVDGLGVLRELRGATPPIGAIMLSAFTTDGADATIAALELGAFDFIVKPSTANPANSIAALQQALQAKIAGFVRQRSRSRPHPSSIAPPAPPRRVEPQPADRMTSVIQAPTGHPEVVAIGVSTGGPQALAAVLPRLPAELAAPVLVVQHMPPLFTRSLAESLDERCVLSVREAVPHEVPGAGDVLIAPGGRQMKVQRDGPRVRIRITDDPPENSCRPAVDYLFRSLASTYGANVLAIIMTGMGSDGTLGCRLLKRQGAFVMTQDEATCTVYGMPRAPAEQGLSDLVVPLDRIADEITRRVGRNAPACR